MSEEWIGVDLDGTAAHYEPGDIKRYGYTYIGKPIVPMTNRIRNWRANGRTVKIFTARAAHTIEHELNEIIAAIEAWCLEHIGEKLPITATKDFHMSELWDDRAIQVITNTGIRVGHNPIAALPEEAANYGK